MPISSAAALMALASIGVAIEADEPLIQTAPAISRAELIVFICMALSPWASLLARGSDFNRCGGTAFHRPSHACLFSSAGTVSPSRHSPSGEGQHQGTTLMKRILLAATAIALMAGPAMTQTVVIAPEQRTVIKDYVVKEKNPSLQDAVAGDDRCDAAGRGRACSGARNMGSGFSVRTVMSIPVTTWCSSTRAAAASSR